MVGPLMKMMCMKGIDPKRLTTGKIIEVKHGIWISDYANYKDEWRHMDYTEN